MTNAGSENMSVITEGKTYNVLKTMKIIGPKRGLNCYRSHIVRRPFLRWYAGTFLNYLYKIYILPIKVAYVETIKQASYLADMEI